MGALATQVAKSCSTTPASHYPVPCPESRGLRRLNLCKTTRVFTWVVSGSRRSLPVRFPQSSFLLLIHARDLVALLLQERENAFLSIEVQRADGDERAAFT